MKKLLFSLAIVFACTSPVTAAQVYSENFDDQTLGANITVYGGDWAVLSPPQYNLTSVGRGGSGYCFSSGSVDEAWLYHNNTGMPDPATDDMYVSFWMRYPTFTSTDTHENIKIFYPHWNGTDSYVHFSMSSDDVVYYSANMNGTMVSVGNWLSYPNQTDGNWHHYEFYVDFQTGVSRAWYDDALVLDHNYGAGWSTGDMYYVTFGSIDAEEVGTFSRQIDDVEVHDSMPATGTILIDEDFDDQAFPSTLAIWNQSIPGYCTGAGCDYGTGRGGSGYAIHGDHVDSYLSNIATMPTIGQYLSDGVYVRHWIKYDANYDWGDGGTSNTKIIKLSAPVSGNLEINFGSVGHPSGIWLQYADTGGVTGSGTTYTVPNAPGLGEWLMFEAWIQIPESGSNNASIHVAINGEDVIDLTGLDIWKNSQSAYTSTTQIVGAGISGPSTPGEGDWWYDDIYVETTGTDPIGSAGDTTDPTVTAFDIPATGSSLTVSVNTFTASDNVAVTDYLLTESATTPSTSDPDWQSSAQTSYTFSSYGSKTLYAWAMDAANNISSSLSDSITLTNPAVRKVGAVSIGGTIQ